MGFKAKGFSHVLGFWGSGFVGVMIAGPFKSQRSC